MKSCKVVLEYGAHDAVMTKERYMGAWRSVNDIQAQAGPERFEEIMKRIEQKVGDEIVVPYRQRAANGPQNFTP